MAFEFEATQLCWLRQCLKIKLLPKTPAKTKRNTKLHKIQINFFLLATDQNDFRLIYFIVPFNLNSII